MNYCQQFLSIWAVLKFCCFVKSSKTASYRLFKTERVCKGFKYHENDKKLLQAISPFSLVFSKDLYCRHVKTRVCLGHTMTPFDAPG